MGLKFLFPPNPFHDSMIKAGKEGQFWGLHRDGITAGWFLSWWSQELHHCPSAHHRNHQKSLSELLPGFLPPPTAGNSKTQIHLSYSPNPWIPNHPANTAPCEALGVAAVTGNSLMKTQATNCPPGPLLVPPCPPWPCPTPSLWCQARLYPN